MIEEFLQSGNLGALHLGLTRNDVRNVLGEPQDYSENNEIWKYGNLQVAFSGHSLSFIGLYFEDGEPENKFEQFLIANRIDFTVDDSLTFDDQKTLRVTPSQVSVTFSQGRLHSMQLTSLPAA